MTIKAFSHTTSDNLHYVKSGWHTPLPTPLFLSLLLPYRQLPQKRGLLLAVSRALALISAPFDHFKGIFEAFKREFLPKFTIEALKVLKNLELNGRSCEKRPLNRFNCTFQVTRRGFREPFAAHRVYG